MKKISQFAAFLLLAICATFVLASCSDDDDKDKPKSSSLDGVYYYQLTDGTQKSLYFKGKTVIWASFNNKGVASQPEKGTYRIDGEKIYITLEGSSGEFPHSFKKDGKTLYYDNHPYVKDDNYKEIKVDGPYGDSNGLFWLFFEKDYEWFGHNHFTIEGNIITWSWQKDDLTGTQSELIRQNDDQLTVGNTYYARKGNQPKKGTYQSTSETGSYAVVTFKDWHFTYASYFSTGQLIDSQEGVAIVDGYKIHLFTASTSSSVSYVVEGNNIKIGGSVFTKK